MTIFRNIFIIVEVLIAHQLAFFDFCAGNRHQIVACARLEAVKVTPELWVGRVEVAQMAQRIKRSPNCGTNCTVLCGLARVPVVTVKLARGIHFNLDCPVLLYSMKLL